MENISLVDTTVHTPSDPSIPELHESLASGNSGTLLALVLFCVIGFLALLFNLFAYLATRFVNQDRNTTIVIIANMCWADGLAGIYSIAKTVDTFLRPPLVNCFLCDSILFTSTIMSSILLVCLQWDIFYKPITFSRQIKQRLMITIVFLWNGAVILGIAPLLGWNQLAGLEASLSTCNFFQYYSSSYLTVICSVLLFSLLCTHGIGIKMAAKRQRIKGDVFGQTSTSITYLEHLNRALITHLITAFCQSACFLPFIIYILVNCYVSDSSTDHALLYLLIVVLSKSVLFPVVLIKRTPQMKLTLKHSRNFHCKSFTCCAMEDTEENVMRASSHRSDMSKAQQSSISIISKSTRSDQSVSDCLSYRRTEPASLPSHSTPCETLIRNKQTKGLDQCAPGHMCHKCGYTNPAFIGAPVRHSALVRPGPSTVLDNPREDVSVTINEGLSQSQSSVVVNPFCRIHGVLAQNKHNE